MNIETSLKIGVAIVISIFCIGIYGNTKQSTYHEFLFYLGFILSLLLACIGVFELFSSSKISLYEKILWSLGMIVIGIIVVAIYYFGSRRKFIITKK